VLRALLIKGAVALDQLTDALGADPSRVESLVERLVQEGLVEALAGGLQLSTEGKLNASAILDADRASLGEERSVELLQAFHAFDRRLKDLVTATTASGSSFTRT